MHFDQSIRIVGVQTKRHLSGRQVTSTFRGEARTRALLWYYWFVTIGYSPTGRKDHWSRGFYGYNTGR